MIMNLIIVSGNLVKDARLVKTDNGKQFCVGTLAIRDDLKPQDALTVFIDFVIWGDRSAKLVKHLTKGRALSLRGRLEIVKRQVKNNVYNNPRIVVDRLEFLGKKELKSIQANGTSVSSQEAEEYVPF
jgi:single-stranded DNA-binding protein